MDGETVIPQVTILAGIPGAGKTTTASRLFAGSKVLSTDTFWTMSGEYKFDPARLQDAHGWNFQCYLKAIQKEDAIGHEFNLKGEGRRPQHIDVDNTNTTIAEIAPYYAAAQAWRFEVRILAVLCSWRTAADRCTHGVPAAKVYQMSLRLEDTLRNLPSWWKLDVESNGGQR